MEGLRIALTLACIGLSAAPAHAQAYPTKPVTIVVTLAAGGAADVIARAVAQRLTEEWGQPVVVENKGGANNQVGTTAVARSAPDGYTLLLTPEHTFTVNPYLYRKLSYDPAKDFIPVTGLVSISQALVVHPSLAMQNVPDLIAAARDKPGGINYGSLGVGSGPHLSMELLQSMSGTKLNAVQYKGAAPALTDVIAGHVPMMFVSTGLIVQAWKAGQLRPLGVGSRERLAQFPELPTVAETLPGFTALVWFGLFAPSGTPRDIVVKINNAVQRMLADRDFRDRFLTPNLYEPMSGSPEQFAEQIRLDAERWQKVIRDAKLAIAESIWMPSAGTKSSVMPSWRSRTDSTSRLMRGAAWRHRLGSTSTACSAGSTHSIASELCPAAAIAGLRSPTTTAPGVTCWCSGCVNSAWPSPSTLSATSSACAADARTRPP